MNSKKRVKPVGVSSDGNGKTCLYWQPRDIDFKALKHIHICGVIMMRKAVFWKSLGVATTDLPLPVEIVASLKKELGEDSPELKFIVFALNRNIKGETRFDIEEYFLIVDEIKKYNLNLNEFKNAIKVFISKKDKQMEGTTATASLNLRCQEKESTTKKLLPYPRVGMVLQRLDPRRPGSCKIVDLNQSFGTVEWRHAKRRTKIALWNLRKSYLFKVVK